MLWHGALFGYVIAYLRELAPLVGQLSDYDTLVFIMQLIEKQKENAFLIFVGGGFKLVKSSGPEGRTLK
jgi:hypothetical protein